MPSLFCLQPNWVLMGVALGWELEVWPGWGKHSLQLPIIGNRLLLKGVHPLSLLPSKVSVGSALKFSHQVGNVDFFICAQHFGIRGCNFTLELHWSSSLSSKQGSPILSPPYPQLHSPPSPWTSPLALGTSFAPSVLLPGMARLHSSARLGFLQAGSFRIHYGLQNHYGWKRPLKSWNPTPTHPIMSITHIPRALGTSRDGDSSWAAASQLCLVIALPCCALLHLLIAVLLTTALFYETFWLFFYHTCIIERCCLAYSLLVWFRLPVRRTGFQIWGCLIDLSWCAVKTAQFGVQRLALY